MNNIRFGPYLNEALKKKFSHLTDRAFIVSSESLRPKNFRLSSRTIESIKTSNQLYSTFTLSHPSISFNVAFEACIRILPTEQLQVSWTSQPVPFYIQQICYSQVTTTFLS
jgi:hypothetical protein